LRVDPSKRPTPGRQAAVNQPTRTSAPPSTGSATPVMKLASSEDAFRDVPAQLFQQRVCAGVVQLGHDVGDRLANPGELAKSVLGDNAVERLDQRRERVRGAQVGLARK
jgi:hypothetical protein